VRPPDAGIHVETFRAITTAEAVATIMESIFMSVDLCVFLCLGGVSLEFRHMACTVSARGNWSRG